MTGPGHVSDESLAFEAFVHASWGRLVRTAILLGADRHAAEDLVQTTLARCYLKWDVIRAARDPDAYVYRVLINTVNAGRRRLWSGEVPTEELPDVAIAGPPDLVEQRRALLVALRRLPQSQREAVVLRYLADFTEAQVAQALGIAVGTVKSRCARALAALAADPTLQEEER